MNKIWIFLIVMVVLNSTVYLAILGWDIFNMAQQRNWESFDKFNRDSGELMLKTQTTISASLARMEEDEDMSRIERQFYSNQVLGALAFNGLLIFGMMGIFGFFFRKRKTSFWLWFKIAVVVIIIVGFLQVWTSYCLYGTYTYPYHGIVDLVNKWDVFLNNWLAGAVPPDLNVTDVGIT